MRLAGGVIQAGDQHRRDAMLAAGLAAGTRQQLDALEAVVGSLA